MKVERLTTPSNHTETSLASFVEEICGESHLRVESDLGGGFVRLRITEAEKRQAAQDIRSTEDIVIELLRNSRDAGAKNIFVSFHRDGKHRKLTIIDDGCGIPSAMQSLVFEPRVTSKLDSAHMDKWGMHGRGMALYSVKANAEEARVVLSEPGKGSSLLVLTNLDVIPEKIDQSTFPVFEVGKNGVHVMRGPKNIMRTVAEFALEHRGECRVFCGSPSEVCAALYAHGSESLDPAYRAFSSNINAESLVMRPSMAEDSLQLSTIASQMGLEVSERTARRIMDGTITAPLNMMDRIASESFPAAREKSSKPLSGTTSTSHRVDFSPEDRQYVSQATLNAFREIAPHYFLNDSPQVNFQVRGGEVHISISLTAAEDAQ